MAARRTNNFTKLGLSLLLTLILIVLVHTSIVLPRRLIVNQQPCDGPALALHSLENKRTNVDMKRFEIEVATAKKALSDLDVVTSKTIQSKDRIIAELFQQLSKVDEIQKESRLLTIDRADDGIRPLRVTVTHHPRSDRVGSFALSSIFLLAITHRWGWEMETLSYEGSPGQEQLQRTFAKLGEKGQYRKDYNPVDLNAQLYSNLAFFPEQHVPPAKIREWTEVGRLPAPGSADLVKTCRKNPIHEGNGYVRCRLILPLQDATGPLQKHMQSNGKLEHFFTPSFRQVMRDRFMAANTHRVKYFSVNSIDYNVAIHVRRGDVNKERYPDRWTDQSVYATIARHICSIHPNACIHVFSEGDNEEGWTTLEQVVDTCGSISFHLFENEFDTWAHFVAADALVTSRSAFSYVPALISGGEIYAPEWGHPPLDHWHTFKNENGKLKQP